MARHCRLDLAQGARAAQLGEQKRCQMLARGEAARSLIAPSLPTSLAKAAQGTRFPTRPSDLNAGIRRSACRLVTRFKANTPLNMPLEMPLEPGSTVLSDRIGFLPARQAMNRKNPMQDGVREIVVRTETGQTLRLLTNDLDAPAQEIADLYKRRLRVELFFRVMKQTLKITRFVGRSENAVRIQIAVALIAFLLLRALQQIAKERRGFLELVRLVRAKLMHRKDPTRLRKPRRFPRSTQANSNSAPP
jgi:hypothetical protein